ncbi:hypothetical protein FHS89_000752 [Rubricella aquisinus]|uniref:DUF3445 domain-containing protein n=1 Tax=Rubricella aquisinus TaxID=2028108 RepID=A0A840WYK2_9RHOB|nr:DUF3445 domain-containing protein [Rubricella aquisinus]MBB5514746.1 hypothetical protein [Rubricella aquisinus]
MTQTNRIVLPWRDPYLKDAPGMRPLPIAEWLVRDADFAAHMAQRDHLVTMAPGCIAAMPDSRAACLELLDTVVTALSRDAGYTVGKTSIRRPDGVDVAIDRDSPLVSLGRLVPEDLLILEGARGHHALTAGVLCFPSQWTLSEKLGGDLLRIHAPVPFYAEGLAPRVQRFFDALRAEQPLWRMNWLFYPSPEMHTPAREGEKAVKAWDPKAEVYLRTERQVLRRLPQTEAVVFSIKTNMTPLRHLSEDDLCSLEEALAALPPVEAAYKSRDEVAQAIARVRAERA